MMERTKSVSEYYCTQYDNPTYRKHMEDRILITLILGYRCIDCYGGLPRQGYFAVFDGHGGSEVADHCSNKLHEILLKTIKKSPEKGILKSLDESFIKVE